MDSAHQSTARRVLIVVAIVALALLLWQIVDAVLLIFIGALLAVLFRGLATRLSARTPLTVGWSLVAVAIIAVALIAAGVIFLGPRVSAQLAELRETLPQSIEQVRGDIQETWWGEYLLGGDNEGGRQLGLGGGDVFGRITGTASRALSILTNLLLVFFAAVFLAVDPELYKRGVLQLVPTEMTARVRETMDASGHALWKWLMGQFIAMAFVAVTVSIGLYVVGIPLALVLGLFAGLFDFVPFIGPIVAAVPAILLGLTIGPTQALYAALVYFVAQQIEGNIVTPLVQQREVSLPPVLILFAVVAAGLLFGTLGIIVATPLVVVCMVAVKMLYVEDVLGKDVSIPGASEEV